MKLTWRTEWPLWLILAGMFAAGLLSWSSLPEQLPVHWNLAGHADRYGTRFEALLLFPLVCLGMYLFLFVVPRVDPGRVNYGTFAGAYHQFRLALLLFMGLLYVAMHLAFRGRTVNMNFFLMPGLGILFVVLGNLMGKLRPNWFIGIRTPWTLTSKLAWVRTHRLGGWVFVASGLLLILAGLVNRSWARVAAFAIFTLAVIALAVYSYLVWKDDPDKTPPAGTRPASG